MTSNPAEGGISMKISSIGTPWASERNTTLVYARTNLAVGCVSLIDKSQPSQDFKTHLCVAVASLVGVNQPQSVQSTTLAVGKSAHSPLRQIRLEKAHTFLHVATVNHANACRSRELRPVACASHPVKIIAKKCIHLTIRKMFW